MISDVIVEMISDVIVEGISDVIVEMSDVTVEQLVTS